MKNSIDAVKDMTLMLLYLTSWNEKGIDDPRGWKSYDFGMLDKFTEEGLIYGSHRSKSVYLEKSGVLQAKALLTEYGIKIERIRASWIRYSHLDYLLSTIKLFDFITGVIK